MGKITTTIWDIEPHTEAKHAILRKYLDAWIPILSSWAKNVNIIDGFSGPGEYNGKEDGSPIIAIKAVAEQKIPISSTIFFLFIEKDKDRYNFLQNKLKTIQIPKNVGYACICGEFSKVIENELNKLNEKNKSIDPTFVFIDPFGFKDTPFEIINKIMKNDFCEILITFMYEEINRFIDDTRLEQTYIKLFGNEKWKDARGKSPEERFKIIHDSYLGQLSTIANFVHSFKMKNKSNKDDYLLFFATKSLLGLERMKEAMWRVDKKGNFEFSDATYNPNQTVLFELGPNFSELKKIMLKEYKGKRVTAKELEYFVIAKTPFTMFHYKTNILKPMEENEEIRVFGDRKRKFSYPDGVIIEFL